MGIPALAEAFVGLRRAQGVPQNGKEKPDTLRGSERTRGS